MSILYEVQERESSFAKGRARRYYLIAKSTGRIGRDDLIQYMVKHASLTPSEAASALDYLFESIPHFLKLGKIIDLGNLGNIKVTIRSEGSDSEEEATVRKVKEIYPHFTPSKKLKEAMQEIPLEKAEPVKDGERLSYIRRQAKLKREQEIELNQKKGIARRALEEGFPVETVMKLTRLSEEEILELKMES
jgi:Bacterial nucleoid DNA-binding protein